MANIAVLGENVVDCVPAGAGLFEPRLGGSPLNVALALARQQMTVCYLSPLSQDSFGCAFASLLRQEQVNIGLPPVQAPSSLAMVQFDEDDQPQYSLYRCGVADRALELAALQQALPAAAQLLHTGSLALEPQDKSVVWPFLQSVKQRGLLLSIDINVRVLAISDLAAYRKYVPQVLALADYIKASDEDLAALWPQLSTAEAIRQIQQIAPDACVILTAGAAGATLYRQGLQLHCPAVTPTTLVDTVGAGDTFFANFIAALGQQRQLYPDAVTDKAQLHQALLAGAIAASLNLARRGCVPPNRQELADALSQFARCQPDGSS